MMIGGQNYWWNRGDGDGHRGVVETIKMLDSEQNFREVHNLHNLRLYSSRMASALSGVDYHTFQSGILMKVNVCKSVIDTIHSFIGTKRPRNEYSVFGGTYDDKERAKSMTRFMSGIFHRYGQYPTGSRVFLDAMIFGTGIEAVTQHNGKIKLERVIPNELMIDENEVRDGEVFNSIRHKEVPAEILADMYPECATEIMESSLVRDRVSYARPKGCKLVSWFEAIHLPTDEHEGRHIIGTDRCTIVDEEWESERFNWTAYKWNVPVLGFWGSGLVEDLNSLQMEINYLARRIQHIMNLASHSIWVKSGDGKAKSSWNNTDFSVREYSQTPPIFLPMPAVDQSYFMRQDALEEKAYRIAGISQLRAQGAKPAGLNSGAALRNYDDIGDGRFQEKSLRWEQFHIDVGELILDVAEQIQDEGGEDLKVLTSGDKEVEEINFEDCRLERNKYVVRPFPTSLLPDTPAGKLETIAELGNLLPEMKPHLVKALDMPDIQGLMSRINSKVDVIDFQIDQMLKGREMVPDTYMDLNLAFSMGVDAQSRWEIDQVPESKKQLLRDWMSRVEYLMTSAQGGGQQPAPSPGPSPEAGMPPGPEMMQGPPMPGQGMPPGQSMPPPAMAA